MLKVALIGAGGISKVHAWCWSQVEGVKLQAICDIEKNRAESLAKVYNADSYTSAIDVTKSSKIDIVDVCTPTPSHKEIVIYALKMGKHTITEKPIARTLPDAKEIVELSKKVDVKFMIAHVVRFFPEYILAKQLIEQGAIGEPRMARAKRGGQYPSNGWKDWYGNREMSGGCMVDAGIHDFDYLRWIFGEVDRVFANALTWKDLNHKDYGLITIRFKSKAIAHVETSWAYPQGIPFGTSFEIIGTDGLISHDSQSSSSLKILMNEVEASSFIPESPLAESPYLSEIRHFVSCVKEDKIPLVTPEDAYKALEIALTALESARTNRVVTVGGEI